MKAIVDQAPGQDLMSISEACHRAVKSMRPLVGAEDVALIEAAGRILAEPFVSRIASPPFTQSAMDGYALAAAGRLDAGARLKVVDRVAAGASGRRLSAGEATRIFTGAPLPDGCDAVVMQEHVLQEGGTVSLLRSGQSGDNVRHQGEDIEPLEPLLEPGIRLDARHIAMLAAQGVGTIRVKPRLRIAVMSTGNELRETGAVLNGSSIYDSNRPMLLSLMAQEGHRAIDGGSVPDTPTDIAQRLRMLAGQADLVVSSGGASIGEEDHSLAALHMAGGSGQVFRIALKPGKPAIVGRIGFVSYLGLPGNPVASLVSWLILGQALVGALAGRPYRARIGYPVASGSTYARRQGRTEFVPARIVADNGEVRAEILGRGGAAQLRPLALSDGLAEIAAECGDVRPGDLIRFHPFSSAFLG